MLNKNVDIIYEIDKNLYANVIAYTICRARGNINKYLYSKD